VEVRPAAEPEIDRIPSEVDKRVARLFLLLKQKLVPPRSQWGKHGVVRIFEHLRCVQTDGPDVVGRTPDLVLQSRVTDYKPEILAELLYEDRLLIEYFDKGLSIIPMEDLWILANRFDYYREKHTNFMDKNDQIIKQLIDTIKYHGPLSRDDIEKDEKVPFYWEDTKFVKDVLEVLWKCGELAVHHREGSRTYYDLVRRVVPERLRKRMYKMPVERYMDFKFIRRLNAVGLLPTMGGGDVWVLVGKSGPRAESGRRLKGARAIRTLRVKESRIRYMYLDKDVPLLQAAVELAGREGLSREVAFLTPFDNLLWAGRMIKDLFGFTNIFEGDIRPTERMYGYYSMPILYGDRFVGRIDPFFVRKDNALEMRNIFWEEGFNPEEEPRFIDIFVAAIADFMSYLGAQNFRFGQDAPAIPRAITQGLRRGGIKIRR